jgi:hypothetical protein
MLLKLFLNGLHFSMEKPGVFPVQLLTVQELVFKHPSPSSSWRFAKKDKQNFGIAQNIPL